MIIKVMYCGYLRKDGTYNNVIFDTEKKKILHGYGGRYTFVEAMVSGDVSRLRDALIADGYTDTVVLG